MHGSVHYSAFAGDTVSIAMSARADDKGAAAAIGLHRVTGGPSAVH